MECYLKENGFDLNSSLTIINQYDKEQEEQNKKNSFYLKSKIIIIDNEEFILSKEDNDSNKNNEEKRAKKAIYDLNRQMTIIKDTIKKSRSQK